MLKKKFILSFPIYIPSTFDENLLQHDASAVDGKLYITF